MLTTKAHGLSVAGADVVMLDNQKPEDLLAAAQRLKATYPHVIIEGSGGITRETIGDFMGEGISVLRPPALFVDDVIQVWTF